MKTTMTIAVLALLSVTSAVPAADPLPSWNDGAAKQSIVSFVEKVTKAGSPSFVPDAERIAVFDNDGTLWCEQPVPVQLYFAIDRVKALAPQAPRVADQEPFASLLKGDVNAAFAGGDRAAARSHHGHARGHDHGGVRADREGLDRHREASEDRQALHRDGLPADARSARVPARERLQELHRLGRRHRVHAPVGGAGVWHSAGAGHWQQHQDPVRDARRQARAGAPAGAELQRRQGRQARRHQPAHRPAAHRRVRQFRRRPADAGIHAGRQRRAV